MRRGPVLNGRITAADRVLLMLLFAAIGTCFAALWTPGGPATEAEIRVGGELRQTLNLSQPGEYHIDGHDGVSVLRVEPGKLRFVESPAATACAFTAAGSTPPATAPPACPTACR